MPEALGREREWATNDSPCHSAEVMAASAAQDWNTSVGTWAGAEFEVGSAYVSAVTERTPHFGGMALPMSHEFGALGRVPFNSADTGAGCIELQMVSQPSPEAVKAVVVRLFSAVPGDEAQVMAKNAEFNVRNVVTLVARPETLLPYALTVRKEVTMATTVNGKRDEGYRLDLKDQWFRYVRP